MLLRRAIETDFRSSVLTLTGLNLDAYWLCVLLSGTTDYNGSILGPGDIGPVRLTNQIVWEWNEELDMTRSGVVW